MPRARVARTKRELGVLPLSKMAVPAASDELEAVWRLTVARRAEAERRLALLSEADWLTSPLHRVIDACTSALIRMAPVRNVARGVLVAQKPAEAEGNPWAGFRVVRGKD